MEPDHTPGPPKKKKIGTSTTKYTLIYTIYCGRARYDYHEGGGEGQETGPSQEVDSQ